ncbi:MAG: hypothetical protein HFH08_05060 [Bacilli bacterium]|nr:hypothetical protein [Bacilli bacterium]
MRKIEMTETEAQALKVELKELEAQILHARGEHGIATREEGGLFNNSASQVIFQDIARWEAMAASIREKLHRATIIKTGSSLDELSVDIEDIVQTEITYEGEEPRKMKFQIGGTMKLSDVINVTYSSPIGKALYGKKVGEEFCLVKPAGSRVSAAKGVILGLVKATDLESSMGEIESKKPYTLEKHS